MATEMRVSGIKLACDTVESGYRIVALEDGRHALVWGNIRCRIGDRLPEEMVGMVIPDEVVARSDGAHGIELHDSYEDAEDAYCDIADAFEDMGGSGATTAAEMRAVLPVQPPTWLEEHRSKVERFNDPRLDDSCLS